MYEISTFIGDWQIQMMRAKSSNPKLAACKPFKTEKGQATAEALYQTHLANQN